MASYLVRIGQIWNAEYIALNHPIMCCAVIAPCSSIDAQSESTLRAKEVATLILGHYEKYWKLGAEMLRT